MEFIERIEEVLRTYKEGLISKGELLSNVLEFVTVESRVYLQECEERIIQYRMNK